MKNFYKNKKILITGNSGFKGSWLTFILNRLGSEIIGYSNSIVSKPNMFEVLNLKNEIVFINEDIRDFKKLSYVFNKYKPEIVFHLAGIKGSPKLTMSKPATFFTNTLLFNLNMMEAARKSNVQKYLYTSSIGVYAPSNIFYEDSVWSTFPSENDKFAGYAKRMGELQSEAYKIEFDWNAVSIVRPSNVYGPFDNFDTNTAMVIPSLISRFATNEEPVKVWGDGSALRDFIFSGDVADGMIKVMEQDYHLPVNLGSGQAVSIREVVEKIQEHFPHKNVSWDNSMPKGDDIRLMDVSRAKNIGFSPKTDLSSGIKKTVQWFLNERVNSDDRYNGFNESLN
jgi:GDP-L-fucose synthase